MLTDPAVAHFFTGTSKTVASASDAGRSGITSGVPHWRSTYVLPLRRLFSTLKVRWYSMVKSWAIVACEAMRARG